MEVLVSETNVNSANPILCPSCSQVLTVLANQNEILCACGFSAFAPYVTEANYLRAGMPKWQARLVELEDAINRGLRPEGSPTGNTQYPAKKPAGAYQYLVGSGSVLLFAGLAAFVGIMWNYLGTFGQGAVLAAITVLLAVLANRLSTRIESTATALSALTVGSWLIDVGWVIHIVYTDWNPTSWVVTTLVIPTLLAIITAVVFSFLGKRFANTVWELLGQIAIPVSVGLTMSSVALTIDKSIGVNDFYLSALALPFTVAILLLVDNGAAVQRTFSSLSRTLSLVVFSGFTFFYVVFSLKWDYVALAWALHLVVLAVFSYSKPRLRAFSAPLLAGSVALSAGFSGMPIAERLAFPALFTLLSLRVGKDFKFPTALLISATSGAWLFFGFAVNSPDELQLYAAGLSVLTGLVVMYHAWLAKRTDFVAIGSGFLALATIFTNVNLDSTKLEAFTLPIAAVFLIGGLFAMRIDAKISSLLWLGPSCGVVLIPSALRATESLNYSPRFNASLVAAILLLVVGARLRYVGMLTVGLIASIILAQNPLTSLFNAVEPWIAFTVSGILLLLIGARFEYLRQRAGAAKAWVTGSLR